MTNKQRQKSIENSMIKKYGKISCGTKLFCGFCKKEKENCCAKAYNRFIYETNKK